MIRWNNYYTAGLIVVVLLAIFLFEFNSFGLFEKTAPVAVVNTTEETVSMSAIEMVDIYKAQIICLTAENQALRDSIALLLKEKEDCIKARSNMKPVVDQLKKLNKTVGNLHTPVLPSPLTEKEYTFTPAPAPTVTPAPTTTRMTAPTTTDKTVVGRFRDGDFKVSYIDGYTTYYISKRLYDDAGGDATPEFMYKDSGQYFKLDGNNYTYRVYGAPSQIWCVYIGNGKGYPAYLPHELLKPSILEARGDLAGYITPSDLQRIGDIESVIRTGGIIPNHVLTGTIPADAQNHWEGWAFVSKL